MPARSKISAVWLALGLLLLAGLGVLFLVVWTARDLPDVNDLLRIDSRVSAGATSPDQSAEGTAPTFRNRTIRLTELPSYVPQAALAAEDREFYHHFGFDPFAIARAIYVDLRTGRPLQGGSTITEQLAKNLLPPSLRGLEFEQKLREMILAVRLEHRFSKDEILEFYLNRSYFGAGAYGIEAAAHRYFGKTASDLTLYQAAMLIGILRAPSRDNPLNDIVLADRRARAVLRDMVVASYLTEDQRRAVLSGTHQSR